MKKNYIIKYVILLTMITTFSSCAVVGTIFKTGMGVGIIIVLAVIGLIVFLISKAGKK